MKYALLTYQVTEWDGVTDGATPITKADLISRNDDGTFTRVAGNLALEAAQELVAQLNG